jgi:hypothetical protein
MIPCAIVKQLRMRNSLNTLQMYMRITGIAARKEVQHEG